MNKAEITRELERGGLKIYHSIKMEGEVIGKLYLHDDVREMTAVMKNTAVAIRLCSGHITLIKRSGKSWIWMRFREKHG